MEVYPRVNSKHLANYIGQTVLLMGEVEGRHDVVRACDGGEVMIHLSPGESFENKYVQLTGRVLDDLSLEVRLATPAGNNFDMKNYNKLVEYINGKYSHLFM